MDQFTCQSCLVDKKKLEIEKAIVVIVLFNKTPLANKSVHEKITYSLPLGYRTVVSIRSLLNLITEKKLRYHSHGERIN